MSILLSVQLETLASVTCLTLSLNVLDALLLCLTLYCCAITKENPLLPYSILTGHISVKMTIKPTDHDEYRRGERSPRSGPKHVAWLQLQTHCIWNAWSHWTGTDAFPSNCMNVKEKRYWWPACNHGELLASHSGAGMGWRLKEVDGNTSHFSHLTVFDYLFRRQ